MHCLLHIRMCSLQVRMSCSLLQLHSGLQIDSSVQILQQRQQWFPQCTLRLCIAIEHSQLHSPPVEAWMMFCMLVSTVQICLGIHLLLASYIHCWALHAKHFSPWACSITSQDDGPHVCAQRSDESREPVSTSASALSLFPLADWQQVCVQLPVRIAHAGQSCKLLSINR